MLYSIILLAQNIIAQTSHICQAFSSHNFFFVRQVVLVTVRGLRYGVILKRCIVKTRCINNIKKTILYDIDKENIIMKLFVNLAWIINIILIAIFIVFPAYNLLIADNYITDPDEVKVAAIMIAVGLLVLSPITCALKCARSLVNRKK